MALPTFHAAGAGQSTTGTSLTGIAYPATVAANDIAICHVMARQSGASPATFPGDWNEVRDGVNGFQDAWAWKRLAGTEGGTTITVTGQPGGGIGAYARIYVFRGCVTSGTPYEAETLTTGASTTYSSSAIVTTGSDRLAICLIFIGDDDKTLTNMTGSNVTWAKTVAEFASGTGTDATLVCEQANVPSALSVTAGSQSFTGSETWGTYTFALLPGPSAYELDAATGAYTVTGFQAQIPAARLFTADPGAYAVTGSAATLLAGRTLSADPGVYAVVGSDASLVTARVISVDPGVYAVTGVAAELVAARILAADPGAYVITGADADLVYGAITAYELDASPSVYAVTGFDAQLLMQVTGVPGTVIGGDMEVARAFGGDATVVGVVGGDRTASYAAGGDRRSDP